MADILLIGSSFFGYRDKVAAELFRQGHRVDVIDDRPSESVAFKSVAKVASWILTTMVANYANTIASKIKFGAYTHVVYMGGMTFLFTREQVKRMRSAAPRATFTAYLWDSMENSSVLAASLDLFDRVLSFDPADCERYGMELRPLFYSEVYADLPLKPKCEFIYDACFIGSVHQPSKFKAVMQICDGLEHEGLRVFRYFYMPSKSTAAFRKLTHSSYRGTQFEYKPLSAERVAKVYALSRSVVDSPQAHQMGLTMRTLETIGAHRKLITTNLDVKNYDFYRCGDVAVVKAGVLPSNAFFEHPYTYLPTEVYESYSIESFAASLLSKENRYHGYERGKSDEDSCHRF